MKRARIRAKTSRGVSRRSTKRAPTSSKPCRREFALYDGMNLIGVIKVAADGAAAAYTAPGKKLGSFPAYEAAYDAFNKSPRRKVGI